MILPLIYLSITWLINVKTHLFQQFVFTSGGLTTKSTRHNYFKSLSISSNYPTVKTEMKRFVEMFGVKC